MKSDDPRTLTIRWFQEIWNEQRESTIDELASDELVGQMEGAVGTVGKEEFRAYFHALTSAISDLHVEVLDTTVDGPKASVQWHLTGRHNGPGLGIPPSGRPVSFRGLTWFEWQDGKLVRGHDRWNRGEVIASLMQVRIEDLRKRYRLTPRQAQVALLMAERRTDKEIARDLGIRPNTVRRHCAMVLTKLGVHSRHEVEPSVGRSTDPMPAHGSDLVE